MTTHVYIYISNHRPFPKGFDAPGTDAFHQYFHKRSIEVNLLSYPQSLVGVDRCQIVTIVTTVVLWVVGSVAEQKYMFICQVVDDVR